MQTRRLLPAEPIVVRLCVQMCARLFGQTMRILDQHQFRAQQLVCRDGTAAHETRSKRYHRVQQLTAKWRATVRWLDRTFGR